MEITLLLAIVVLAAVGIYALRREMKEPRFKTVLIVNIDSLERDEHDLPKKRVQMRKTIVLCAPVIPGIRVEELGLDKPLKVLETIVSEGLIAAYLEPINVPISAVEGEANSMESFEWKIAD